MGAYRKKRTNKRKRRVKRRPRFNMHQGFISGLPKQRTIKMRYSGLGTLVNPADGTIVLKQFRANGIFDPDYTGTGHQPMGYDQWKSYYNHYVVLGSRISVRIIPSQDSAGYSAAVGMYLSDNFTLPYTEYTAFIEANKGSYTICNGASTNIKALHTNYSAKKFFNVTDVKDNLDRLGSAQNADPTEAAVYNLWYQAADLSTGPTNLQYIVTIDYIVSWSEPQDLAQS